MFESCFELWLCDEGDVHVVVAPPVEFAAVAWAMPGREPDCEEWLVTKNIASGIDDR